jgi:hypothetical protein
LLKPPTNLLLATNSIYPIAIQLDDHAITTLPSPDHDNDGDSPAILCQLSPLDALAFAEWSPCHPSPSGHLIPKLAEVGALYMT